MDDEKFEEIMDKWTSHEIESAPQLRPKEEMYRKIQAKQRKPIFPLRFRWVMAGVAIASIIMLIMVHPVIFRVKESPFIGQREGFPSEKGSTVRGSHGKGPKKGSIFFKQLMFQYQKRGSRIVQGVDIRVPLEETITLSSDDNYRLFFQPIGNWHIYIYQVGSSDNLIQLFPNNMYSSVQNPLQQGQKYYLPSKPNWLYLAGQNTGKEQLYIITSAKPLQDWEDLYTQYEKTDTSQDKQELHSQLLKEIKAVEEESGEEVVKWMFPFNHR